MNKLVYIIICVYILKYLHNEQRIGTLQDTVSWPSQNIKKLDPAKIWPVYTRGVPFHFCFPSGPAISRENFEARRHGLLTDFEATGRTWKNWKGLLKLLKLLYQWYVSVMRTFRAENRISRHSRPLDDATAAELVGRTWNNLACVLENVGDTSRIFTIFPFFYRKEVDAACNMTHGDIRLS